MSWLAPSNFLWSRISSLYFLVTNKATVFCIPHLHLQTSQTVTLMFQHSFHTYLLRLHVNLKEIYKYILRFSLCLYKILSCRLTVQMELMDKNCYWDKMLCGCSLLINQWKDASCINQEIEKCSIRSGVLLQQQQKSWFKRKSVQINKTWEI